MHRFFTPWQLHEGSLMVDDAVLAHQVRVVLRMKPNDEIILFTGGEASGWDFRFCIERVTDRVLSGRVTERIKNEREPRVYVTLFQAILKKDNLEFIFEKCTEVGVSAFVPILSDRSIKKGLNGDRAQKIVKEASEQSGRAYLPDIQPTMSYRDAVVLAKEAGGLNVLLHEKETRRSLDTAPPTSRRISLFVGPEGGFSEKEIVLARNAGFFVTSISRRVLRAETAAIVGSYAVLHRFGN